MFDGVMLEPSHVDSGLPKMESRNTSKKNIWTPDEDEFLKTVVRQEGVGQWVNISNIVGRTAKQCRERWCNQLDSRLHKGEWTNEEDEILLNAQMIIGNRWSKIASLLKSRALIDVKNRFYKLKRKYFKLASAKKLQSGHNDACIPQFSFHLPSKSSLHTNSMSESFCHTPTGSNCYQNDIYTPHVKTEQVETNIVKRNQSNKYNDQVQDTFISLNSGDPNIGTKFFFPLQNEVAYNSHISKDTSSFHKFELANSVTVVTTSSTNHSDFLNQENLNILDSHQELALDFFVDSSRSQSNYSSESMSDDDLFNMFFEKELF